MHAYQPTAPNHPYVHPVGMTCTLCHSADWIGYWVPSKLPKKEAEAEQLPGTAVVLMLSWKRKANEEGVTWQVDGT